MRHNLQRVDDREQLLKGKLENKDDQEVANEETRDVLVEDLLRLVMQ